MTQLTCDYCKAVGVADTDSIDVAIAAAVKIGWVVKELGQIVNGKREFIYHQCPDCWAREVCARVARGRREILDGEAKKQIGT